MRRREEPQLGAAGLPKYHSGAPHLRAPLLAVFCICLLDPLHLLGFLFGALYVSGRGFFLPKTEGGGDKNSFASRSRMGKGCVWSMYWTAFSIRESPSPKRQQRGHSAPGAVSVPCRGGWRTSREFCLPPGWRGCSAEFGKQELPVMLDSSSCPANRQRRAGFPRRLSFYRFRRDEDGTHIDEMTQG